jgi:hypothetical protein
MTLGPIAAQSKEEMKNTFKKSRSQIIFRFIFCAGLALDLGGCVSLYDYPAVAKRFDSQSSFPALQTSEVYFFLSKEAFPTDLQFVPVGTLFTPENSQWTDPKLVGEFQKKAAEIGANAVVFESIQTNKLLFGFLYYTGYATAYRLYKDNPTEDVDLSSTQYGTQNPDLQKVK